MASCEVICGTTAVLLCTTKNYNVLLQYYSNVLLRTTTYYSRTTLYHKVLLCTTKYYSSTTLYYKVLCQYYKVLRQLHAPAASETFPVRSWRRRFCIVKYNISRPGYFPKCHEVLRLPRKVTLQPHQILRLPHKINVTNDPHHICNVISNAWSKVRIAGT